MARLYQSTTTAPVNIATLKYWGKRDKALNLPTNSSISVTLSQDELCTTTTACASQDFTEDALWLNGDKEIINPAASSDRLVKCLVDLRQLRAEVETADPTLPKLSAMHLHIISENNFPTAAGLASSAAGFAALVRAVADLFELPQSPSELSKIARKGSGSACRSLFGGYVAWEMGVNPDGSDSKAVQISPVEHWPEMRAAVLVVNAGKKDVSSTSGMQTTVATSPLFDYRVKKVVPERYTEMWESIREKDFGKFAHLTMADSNQFHAVCLDSFPPIFYLNDVSRNIIRIVEQLNTAAGRTVAAYTFDAGPNAVIYYLEENAPLVLGVLARGLYRDGKSDVVGWTPEAVKCVKENPLDAQVESGMNWDLVDGLDDAVKRVILTKVGQGPVKIEESLVNEKGEPKK